MTFKIEKDVPPPPTPTGELIYPFAEMEVGDSFFAPGKKQKAVSQSARKYGKRTGTRFSSRTTVEDGVQGVRVWRIS